MVGEGVMKTAADIEGDSVAQRAIGSEHSAACAEPIRLNQSPGVRDFQLPFFALGQSPRTELAHVLGGMHQQDIFIARWRRRYEVRGTGDALLEEAFAHQPVCWKPGTHSAR